MERYDYYALGERLQDIIQFAVDVQALCEYADVKDGLGKNVFDSAAESVCRQLSDWFSDGVNPPYDLIGMYPAGLKAVVADRLPLGTARLGKCVGPSWVGVAGHAFHRAMLIIEDAKLGPLNYFDFWTGMANGAPACLKSHKDAWEGFDRHQLIAELTIELAAAEAREPRPDDGLITINEIAAIAGVKRKTVDNISQLPTPVVAAAGTTSAKYRYSEIRQWAIARWPARCGAFPETFTEAQQKLKTSVIP